MKLDDMLNELTGAPTSKFGANPTFDDPSVVTFFKAVKFTSAEPPQVFHRCWYAESLENEADDTEWVRKKEWCDDERFSENWEVIDNKEMHRRIRALWKVSESPHLRVSPWREFHRVLSGEYERWKKTPYGENAEMIVVAAATATRMFLNHVAQQDLKRSDSVALFITTLLRPEVEFRWIQHRAP